jgi:hypothetical protein
MTYPRTTRPLRIVFYRPHTEIWFKEPVRHLIRGESLPHKYEALFDVLLTSGAEVSISTELYLRGGWKGLLRYFLDPFGLIIWVLANKISLSKIGFVFSKAGLGKHDVLFFMHYGNFTYEDVANAQRGSDLALALSDVDILKLGHLTHYAYQPAIGSNNLKKLGVNLLVAENNLKSNSDFYRKYFDHLDADFWCLPFIAAERFKSTTSFRERSCKLVATGSITFKMIDPDFINFFQTDELQPLRRQIYEQAHLHAAEIDSLISDLNASRATEKVKVDSLWCRLLRRFRPHPQRSYYKKNIVDVYNSYMMFTVPEEVCDLPAIGVVEGMACGCVFFGLDSPMYRDLGMVPGIHYVAHDGTLEDLLEKIRYFQNPAQLYQLEQIAKSGYELVTEKFRAEVVYGEFLNRLTELVLGCESIGNMQ